MLQSGKMKIFITGGAGFIGSHLAALLSKSGHSVCVFDNYSASDYNYLQDTNCKQVVGDILDSESLIEAAKDHELIIHLAAKGNVIESVASPVSNFQVNVIGTINVLEACRKNKIKKIIFSSTGGALMGDTLPPVHEDSIPNPISPYGSSKLCAETYIKSYSKCYDIKYTIFRFGNVLGTNSIHKMGVINAFYKKLKHGNEIDIYGKVSRDFIYVFDLVNAIKKSISIKAAENEIFHLASGKEVTIEQLAKSMIEIMNAPKNCIKYNARRVGEVERNFANIQKAEQIIGFSNTKEINMILHEVINYFKINNY